MMTPCLPVQVMGQAVAPTLPGMVSVGGSPMAATGTMASENMAEMGGQRALNSYRHAGAALLQSLQLDRMSGNVPTQWNQSSGGPGPATSAGTRPGTSNAGHTILSTSPGKSEAVQASFLSTPPPQGRGAGCGGGQGHIARRAGGGAAGAVMAPAQPSFYMHDQQVPDPMLQQTYPCSSAAPSAALGLLEPAKAGTPSEVEAPAACRELAEAPTLQDAYLVRNTFIDYKPERSPSLERFFEERKCRSSPTSRPASRPLSRQVSQSSLKPCALDMEDPFAIATPTDSVVPTPRGPFPVAGGHLLSTPPVDTLIQQVPSPQKDQVAANIGGGKGAPVLRLSQLISEPEPAAEGPTAVATAAAARLAKEIHSGASLAPSSATGLRPDAGSAVCSTAAPSSLQGSALIMGRGFSGSGTSSAAGSGLVPGSVEHIPSGDASRSELVQSNIGTVEIPSRGSALHPWGACKPCAFVFQDGCANGTECEFCHLCEPGERKRRKKERRKLAAGWKLRYGTEC
mmetsp:Transcript_29912/g.75332  ORF Transcript_29912/g.75332 Transcript_29912/m.75332 type:complete len:513 (-) Transcript_29912:203-1741(-)